MSVTQNKRTKLRLFRSKNEQVQLGSGDDRILLTIEHIYPTKVVMTIEAQKSLPIDRVERLPGNSVC